MMNEINYTNGKEFKIKQTGQVYIGYYNYIRGKYYTGKKYVYKKSKELEKIQDDGDNNFFPWALKFKDLIIDLSQQPKQLQIVDSLKQNESNDVISVYILRDLKKNKIFQVSLNTYNIYKYNKNYVSCEIKLQKKIRYFENFGYNIQQVGKIQDKLIANYIKQRFKQHIPLI